MKGILCVYPFLNNGLIHAFKLKSPFEILGGRELEELKDNPSVNNGGIQIQRWNSLYFKIGVKVYLNQVMTPLLYNGLDQLNKKGESITDI